VRHKGDIEKNRIGVVAAGANKTEKDGQRV